MKGLKDPLKRKGVSKSVLPGELEIDLVEGVKKIKNHVRLVLIDPKLAEGVKRTDKKNFRLSKYYEFPFTLHPVILQEKGRSFEELYEY